MGVFQFLAAWIAVSLPLGILVGKAFKHSRHNLTYRDTAIPALLPSRRSGRVNSIDAPATIGSNLLHGVPND